MDTCSYWLIGIVAFLIVEGLTYQFVCIWFALGSVIAMVAGLCGASWPVQIAAFIVTSAVTLVATRPFIKKLMRNRPILKTNVERLEGLQAIVVQKISNSECTGQVKVDGSVWSAKNITEEDIDVGDTVIVKTIEGVKLIVEKIKVEEMEEA